MILVTGAEGLIGRHLCAIFRATGVDYRPFDIKRSEFEDVRNAEAVAAALRGVRGVVHLAAVSRVVWGERDPDLCDAVNVRALQGLLQSCLDGDRPWLVFASSREVYGQARVLPVGENDPQQPLNHYAWSKYRGERLVEAAAAAGLVANICRLSSVYGCPHDHTDRVTMAFALAAAGRRERIAVEGAGNTFDFTSVREVAEGLWRLIQATSAGEQLPPIHFVSGRGTTLGELAQMAVEAAAQVVPVEEAPPRTFDVSRFIGDPSRARSLIGWAAQADLRSEFRRLVHDLSPAAAERPGG